MDRKVISELIQHDFNRNNLTRELKEILFNRLTRENILKDYDTLKQKLGNKGASAQAARMIVQYLKKNEV
jgi:lipid-A-disaccharide synthase